MVDVRELVVRINAVDSATKVVEHITSLINEGNKSSLALKIDDSAINSVKSTIDDLYSSIKAPINIAADTTSADSTIGNFASNAESIVNDTSAFIQESVTSATKVVEHITSLINEGNKSSLALKIDDSAINSATKVVEHITSLINEGNKSSLALKIDEAAISSVKSTIDDLYSTVKAPINIAADAVNADSTINDFVQTTTSSINDTSNYIEDSINSAFNSIDIPDTNISNAFPIDVINNAEDAISDLWREEETTIDVTEELGSKSESMFGSIKKAADEVQNSIGNVIASFTAMAAGSAIAGISWKDAMASESYTKDVMAAIDSNKKLGVSADAVKAKANSMANEGWISSGTAIKEMFSTLNLAHKELGRSEEERISNAAAISKATFANELLEGYKPETLLGMFARKGQGALKGRQLTQWLKLGFDEESSKSVKKRIDAMVNMGKKVNIETEFKEEPWTRVEISLAKLKKSIGLSIGEPMAIISNAVATLSDNLNKIPGAPGLLGMIAIFIALSGALSLVIAAFTPLVSGLAVVKGALLAHAATAITAAEAEIMAATGVTAHAFTLAGLRIALMNAATAAYKFTVALLTNPLTWVAVAIAGIIYLAYHFGYLKRAWDAFAKSNFGKDILAFFNILEFKIKVVWAGIKGLFSILMGGIGSKLSGGIVTVFESIAKIIGNVWNKFNAFYSALKGGDISLVLGTAGGLFESLGFLGPMFWLLSFTFKILKTIYDFLKDPVTKIKEFLGFIWNVLTGLWKWLMKAIPGAEKASMKSKMEKEAEKEGKKYGEKWGVSASGEYITLDENGQPTGNKVMASKITPKMKELQGKYDTLPGFAEGIADAVKQGISGFAKTIAEEIGTRLEAAFDAIFGEGTFEATMKSLSETLDALQDWLEDNGIMDKKGTPEQQAAARKLMEEKGGVFNEDTGKWKFGDLPEGQLPEDLKTTDWAAKALGWFPGIGPGILSKYFNDSIETPEDLEKAFLKAQIDGALPQAASGAGILESGPLFGHANESIVPAKLATSSTLIDTLTKIADSKRSGSVSGDSVNIYNTFNFHSHGSAGFDAKTRSELTTFIDNYMARALRHRQAH